ncbi:YciI family protein [Catellatospora coxensis]|uniref:YCII-related domain-containing protein n=1 Tax=Catellatospora coxensis TaxID=310354 RepID=A0A8J3PB73_9ACTN|nr:YciI family protein [Catellatospora coxensis]GIG10592.1 hypothetical protein Cco03nite_72920 [Catellatospora coxensis]
MRYVLLIHSDPESWVHPMFLPCSPDPDRRDARTAAFDLLLREITDSGELVAAAALADPVTGRTLHPHGEVAPATDGPVAPVLGHVAGFLVVDVDSAQRALEVASRLSANSPVEIRPVMGLSGMEM